MKSKDTRGIGTSVRGVADRMRERSARRQKLRRLVQVSVFAVLIAIGLGIAMQKWWSAHNVDSGQPTTKPFFLPSRS
ncbi:MAG: hypothetical protein JO235_20425 [Chroococcidiopsidaceae cyanobacterium CP_BM_RX_35]|nr:hypothetical protein [Chroococcidiopsidaceae cyanobacterium CP_BM_RX_35]